MKSNNKLPVKPPNGELRIANRPVNDNPFLKEVENPNVRHAIIILGKLIAKLVPFDKIDETFLALSHEVESNLRLANKEMIKFVKADTILHLLKEMKTGKFTIGIQQTEKELISIEPPPFLFEESIINKMAFR